MPELPAASSPFTVTRSRPRVLIAGGGTGGHIIPALAVARELVSGFHTEILFVGTARGMESRLVPESGFALQLIEVGPLNKVSLLTRVRSTAQLPASLLACVRVIREFGADVVFGVGGYASGPAMGAAILMRVPTIAFEPNAVPGMANRLVGKRVHAASVNFPPAARWFRNAEVTGIPVRPEFFSLPVPDPNAPPHLLVFGGSQGARIFNALMPPLAPALLQAVPGLTVLHQAGVRHAELTRTAYEASGADPLRWRVEAFLDNMAAEFSSANLLMARSGASTVAELAAAGKPSLLIPFAAAADQHQLRNAEVMVNANGAVMLEEGQLGHPDLLLSTLTTLLNDPLRLKAMAGAAQSQARPGAARRIAERIVTLCD